eukprot:770214-Prorocentrum_lima.AAC.1
MEASDVTMEPRQPPNKTTVPVRVVEAKAALDPLLPRFSWLGRGSWKGHLTASPLGSRVSESPDLL